MFSFPLLLSTTKAMIMTLPAAQVPAGLEAFDIGSCFEGWQGSVTRCLPPGIRCSGGNADYAGRSLTKNPGV